MNPPRLIVGLGNPGSEYAATRHNVGFWFVDHLADKLKTSLAPQAKFYGKAGRIGETWLLQPMTFMNRFGQSVAALANFYKISAEEILVIHDELDLPPGVAKLKLGGGHGGHNGLRDIIAQLGNNNNFYRLRLGIGHPGVASMVSNFVLGRAPRAEQEKLDASIDFALGVLPDILAGEWNRAMKNLHSQKA